jgi:hypothetical protein
LTGVDRLIGDVIYLRTWDAEYTGISTVLDGYKGWPWGAGVRPRDGKFVDACSAAVPKFGLNVPKVKMKQVSTKVREPVVFSSSVLCGTQEKLWVRHQFLRSKASKNLIEVQT